jgi:hypothetical protein
MFKAFKPVVGIDAVIACYPRSGSTYLGKLFEQRTLRHAKKTHSLQIDEDTTVIGIFRDPAESISSFISKSVNMSKKHIPIENLDENGPIAHHANNYQNHLRFLIDRSNCLIEFSSFIKDPEACISRLSDFLNVEIVRLDEFIDDMDESRVDSFIKTSKTLDNYQKISDLVGRASLDKCYELFQEAKDSDKRIV